MSIAAAADVDALFGNHLAFLGTHRGSLAWENDSVRVEGFAPFLSSWTPLTEEATLPPEVEAVRLVPLAGTAWDGRLDRAGYRLSESLVYMELGQPSEAVPTAQPVQIRSAQSEADARAFASVQASAFLAPGSPDRLWWIDCFNGAAIANFARPDQDFLIAWIGDQAAAVLLSVQARGVAGIYAVATRPEHQRKGLSTALLGEARRRAKARGLGRIALQAVAGSYAESFYRKLGFEQRYVSRIWRPAPRGVG